MRSAFAHKAVNRSAARTAARCNEATELLAVVTRDAVRLRARRGAETDIERKP